MVVGIGVDIVDVARFERSLERTPRLSDRLFGEAFDPAMTGASLAARFAAKEATLKALGGHIPGFRWTDIQVVGGTGQTPQLALTGSTHSRAAEKDISSQHVSLSHDGGMAIAFVVMESSS